MNQRLSQLIRHASIGFLVALLGACGVGSSSSTPAPVAPDIEEAVWDEAIWDQSDWE